MTLRTARVRGHVDVCVERTGRIAFYTRDRINLYSLADSAHSTEYGQVTWRIDINWQQTAVHFSTMHVLAMCWDPKYHFIHGITAIYCLL